MLVFASSSSHRRPHLGTRSGRNIPKLWYTLDHHLDNILMEEASSCISYFDPQHVNAYPGSRLWLSSRRPGRIIIERTPKASVGDQGQRQWRKESTTVDPGRQRDRQTRIISLFLVQIVTVLSPAGLLSSAVSRVDPARPRQDCFSGSDTTSHGVTQLLKRPRREKALGRETLILMMQDYAVNDGMQ